MKQTPLEHRIFEIACPVAQDLGLVVVRVRVMGDGKHRSVQVMAENIETKRLKIEDCTKLSKALSVSLDVEDPVDGAYRLEVSSPGIDRPLVRQEDFKTYAGFEAKLETSVPTENGQKRFRGRIEGIQGGIVSLSTDQGHAEIDFSMLTKAKLVLTDELIKATAIA